MAHVPPAAVLQYVSVGQGYEYSGNRPPDEEEVG
jgi:hypothetical protein